jgi:tRNA nucleotidyltransferase/poly(A) polymerase
MNASSKPKIYLVGGAVRDKLLGIKSKDCDYAVECESWDAMKQYILNNGGKIFLETPKYFTMRAIMPNLGAADFVLCRRDGKYLDGRHPETVDVGTIQDDLARRDFTINAIAIEVDSGAVIDPFNGQHDIKEKIIRFVGSPMDRMEEDKLRAFRAIRFAITKGFAIHFSVKNAIRDLVQSEFAGISTERIREEIAKMFAINTKQSFEFLFRDFPTLGEVALERGIWFRPTTERKS